MAGNRQHFSTGNIYEKQAGFSRAVRVGNTIFTAGTIAVDEHGVTQGSDCYEQCMYIAGKLEAVLEQAGSRLQDVVKLTAYITDIKYAEQFSRFTHDCFSGIAPAATCVVVKGLFGEGTVVELEMVAVVAE